VYGVAFFHAIIKDVMSIGPSDKTKIEEVPAITRFNASARKAVAQYFTRPAYYLFYGLLTLGAVALLIGTEPPITFWILLTIIGVFNLKPPAEDIVVTGSKKNSNAKRK
jgi:hypothetical protein